MSNGTTNEIFQSGLINCIAFMEVNRSRLFRIKASIEECILKKAPISLYPNGTRHNPNRNTAWAAYPPASTAGRSCRICRGTL